MSAHTYEKSKKIALNTILFLGLVTILEVCFALVGKGYIIEGVEFHGAIIAGVMITASIVKAYYIVFEFMHMKYEVKGLSWTVVAPTVLLIWGIIAFMWDADTWKNNRDRYKVDVKQEMPVMHKNDAHGETHGLQENH